MNANLRNFALWVIIVLLLLALFTLFQNPGQRASSQDISFSQLLSEVDQGHVRDVVIQGPEIHGTLNNGSSFQTYAPNDPTLVKRLYDGKVQITAKPPGDNVPWFVSLLVSWLPFIALIGVWIFLSRQMQGGAGKAMGFGKSRAKMLTEAHGRVTFEQAKKNAPCIIFIDEIDAVGRHRGAGLGGGNDEREQTLNQLLVEMDGFEMKDNIILIAATNRPDILDPALLRPGRFDRQIVVDRPDRVGRQKILEVHTKGKPLAPEIDLSTLAAGTPGFTGADLANLVNEAALLAARRGKKIIEQDELEEGIMRVIAGPEKKARLLSEHERKITAYHEMGHALVGHFLEHTDPVHKITIVSRGQALGLTISLPTEDRYLTTRTALMHQMAMMLGGRAAEEIVFHEVTTGAANDLEKVTATSKAMIMKFGMSEKLGPRVLGRGHDQPFLGRDYGAEADYSEEIAREIDDEIRRVIEEAHELALSELREHMEQLHRISQILIERETIDRDQFERLLAGEDESTVFPEPEVEPETPAPAEEPKRERQPGRPRPFPLPGATMQPPPDPAK